MSVAPPSHTAVEAALVAGTRARAAAEQQLHRARAVRSRAAVALEHTARLRGCDEAERERLRTAYAAADHAVAQCQADLDRAREIERAWRVVACSLDGAAEGALPAALAADSERGVAVRTRPRPSRALPPRPSLTVPRAAQPRPA